MKRERALTNDYLSAFFLELGYILRSGVPLGNGLLLLRDDDDSPSSRRILDSICESVDGGETLSAAMLKTGRFSEYAVRSIELAERTGKLEGTVFALSRYYEQQRLFRLSMRQALLYPAMLLVVFIIVVAVLITEVIPIFDSVFRQLGSTLSPVAQGLLDIGSALSGASVTIAVVLGILALIVLVTFAVRPARRAVSEFLYRHFGSSGVWGEQLRARFASAMSTGIASGLDANESIDSAAALVRGTLKMDAGIEKCRAVLQSEGKLSTALSESGIFSARNSRMIAIGFETGNIDEVMREIALRTEQSAQERLTGIVSAIEPTIVILTSIVAGAILLSVMLPLVSIMSGIG